MKRFLILVTMTLILSIFLGSVLTACDSGDIKDIVKDTAITLTAPTTLRIEDGCLMWNPVENATRYTVSIDGREYPCDDFRYPLTNIVNGEHVFKVKAVGDNVLTKSSAFSEELRKTFADGGIVSASDYYGNFDELTKKESFLGYGFDVINSSVFSDKYVKTNFPIFDIDELMNLRLLKVDSKQSFVDEVQSSSMEEFMSSWNANANVNVSWGKKKIGGSVDVSAKYSGGVENAKSLYYHCISISNQKFYIVLQGDMNTYRRILLDSFSTDLYSDMEPSVLFDRYGTHFITSAVMGGKINSYYLYSSEEEKTYHDISAQVSVDVRYLVGKTNVDVSGGYMQEAKSQNIHIKNTLQVIGGGDFGMLSDADIGLHYAEWEKSLDSHPSLMGIKDSGSLIGIWELIDASKDTREYTWDYTYMDENGKITHNEGKGNRSQQLQAYFETYGIDSYNALRRDAGLHEIIVPESIDNVKVNSLEPIHGEYEVFAGTDNDISFTVSPAQAVGYTKSISLTSESEFASVSNEKGLFLTIAPNCPHDTTFDIVLSAGGVRKIVTVRVIRRFTVNFVSNGGTEVAPIRNIRWGTHVDEPTAPTKTGKIFKGWYTDPDFAPESLFDFSASVQNNITLYAKWEDYYPTLTFVHDAPGCELLTAKTKYDTTYPFVAPVCEGYTFAGCFCDEERLIPFDFARPIDADTTIYVKWNITYFPITFDANGGTDVPSQSVAYGGKVTKPAVGKEGYELAGWYRESTFLTLFDFSRDTVTEDLTLYARWSANLQTVYFEVNGGDPMDSRKIEYGSAYGNALSDATRTGYTFKGWYTDSETFLNRVYPETLVTANTTLYAKWEANTYTVHYDANGGTGTMASSTHVYDTAQELAANMFSRNGYTFDCWNTRPDGKGISYANSALVKNLINGNETATLYAMWEVDPYTIGKYVANGTIVSDTSGSKNYSVWNTEIPCCCSTWNEILVIDLSSMDSCTLSCIDVAKNTYIIGKKGETYDLPYLCLKNTLFLDSTAPELHLKDFNMASNDNNGAIVQNGDGIHGTVSSGRLLIEVLGDCSIISTQRMSGATLYLPHQDVTILGSGNLTIIGADGADSEFEGDRGQDGGIAAYFDHLTVDMTGFLFVIGGNGGAGCHASSAGSAGSNGGNGGTGVCANKLFVGANATLYVKGGKGGNGGNGADGNVGAEGKTNINILYGGKDGDKNYGERGQEGGDGGNGGQGGAAIIIELTYEPLTSNITLQSGLCGDGGDGGNGGNGGRGGNYYNSLGSVWQCGGGSGGNGGKGGDGNTPGIGGIGGYVGEKGNSVPVSGVGLGINYGAVFSDIENNAVDGVKGADGEIINSIASTVAGVEIQ